MQVRQDPPWPFRWYVAVVAVGLVAYGIDWLWRALA